jgi:tight adherence protein C
MSEFVLPLIALFASVALLAAVGASSLLTWMAPSRRRLLGLEQGVPATGVLDQAQVLTDEATPQQKKLAAYVPKSPKEMGRLQRRLAAAGYHGFTPVLIYSLSEIAFALLGFAGVYFFVPVPTRLLFALAAGAMGYMIPAFFVARRIRLRRKQIENGLPDALDLLIVSIEAGLAIDQAILKCAEELALPYPALAHELQMVNIETRAGKPRLEAFKNFAKRTQVDDVRALVAMLIQTDRFGTSVAQALRTHAEESRVKRRQRAEEKAAKLSVKLIFPLVFCLLPAFFVVSVGPAIIKFVDFFSNMKFPGA